MSSEISKTVIHGLQPTSGYYVAVGSTILLVRLQSCSDTIQCRTEELRDWPIVFSIASAALCFESQARDLQTVTRPREKILQRETRLQYALHSKGITVQDAS